MIRGSNQSPWCVTWPGPCHHKAPVVAEKYPPLPLPAPHPTCTPHHHLFSSIAQPRESERERQRETDRKRESRQRPCECVSYGTDLVLMTPAHTHTRTHSSSPHSVPTLCHPVFPTSPPPCPLVLASIIPTQGMQVGVTHPGTRPSPVVAPCHGLCLTLSEAWTRVRV